MLLISSGACLRCLLVLHLELALVEQQVRISVPVLTQDLDQIPLPSGMLLPGSYSSVIERKCKYLLAHVDGWWIFDQGDL